MKTVGILGGGQLARMLALAGAPLGLHCVAFDQVKDACCAPHAHLHVGDWSDHDALARFAQGVDVVTFDFENVSAASARWLSGQVLVQPNPDALAVSQDRLSEKTLFAELGIPVPAFAKVSSLAGLHAALDKIGLPAILKTRRMGYDGKGQFRLRAREDVDAAWATLGGPDAELILEAFVPFERELSVIAVRGPNGEFHPWPITQNWHVDGVLSASFASAAIAPELEQTAFDHARAVAERLDYVGVFALELFDVGGHLFANEMAPRVHNSGHWTLEGAETSQFENHLRAILGLPLGATTMRGHAVMLNWIGALPDVRVVLDCPGAHWHAYGKSPRVGRKVGHVTVRADCAEALAGHLIELGARLGREAQVAPVLERLVPSGGICPNA